MTPSTLILLRHGESQWNLENRFTGWADVPLTLSGQREAVRAGALLREAGILPDVVFSSVLIRCVHTTWRVLDELDRAWMPFEKTWRLNERHYGALQGLNKQETAHRLDEERVNNWRKSYRGIPPADYDAPAALHSDPRYRHVLLPALPFGESLEMTALRVLPWWENVAVPHLHNGETMLIVAHRNSLRVIIKFLTGMTDDATAVLHVPTGEPILYDLDKDARVVASRLLTESLQMRKT